MRIRNGLFALLNANKGRGQFHAKATGNNEATIWLYDAIVRDDSWGGVSALTVGKALAEHADKATIHLRIDSPGGDVFAGRAMEQLIKEHPGNVITHIDGFAASAASYVALAGNEVQISQGGQIMIHKAWTLTWGNADDLSKTVNLLNQIDEALILTYADRTGQDAEQIRKWISAETWFTADDAVKYGFADKIAGDVGADQPGASNADRAWDLSAYANAPQGALPAASSLAPKSAVDKAEAAESDVDEFDRDAALRRLAAAAL